jgi:hypothetical protein
MKCWEPAETLTKMRLRRLSRQQLASAIQIREELTKIFKL